MITTPKHNQDEHDTHPLRYKSANDILGSLRDEILTHTDKLNDFTAGSALETLLEAFAIELQMYYHFNVDNIKGSIDKSMYSAFKLAPQPEQKAYGQFIVTFSNPLPNALQIPRGTQFSSSDPLYNQTYNTLTAYDVPKGTQRYAVTAYCTEGGSYGNIPAAKIDSIDNFPEADSVVNPAAISTGRNQETLEEAKVRFRNLIQGLQRGTVQAVQKGAMDVPGITGAFVDESVGYVRVYCHDANGDLPRNLQKQVQENMVNWRPAGIPVEVFPVHKTIIDVGVTLDVPNKTLRTPSLLDEVQKRVTNYINSRQASQDLVVNNIVTQVMSLDDMGIDNVQVVMFALPDVSMIDGASVNENNSILINEHIFNKNVLVPKDRAEFDDYVHTPGDRDNPPYASNAHGDGYITADLDKDTQDPDGSIDNDADNETDNPLPKAMNNDKTGQNQDNTTVPSSVSATDAQPNTPLRILNRYRTSGQEIVRCGTVKVNYNEISDDNVDI